MKRRLNILSILVFIVLGLSLYTTGYQFGTGMKAGMSLAKEQHKESKACDRPMLAGDFRFVDVVPTIAMIKPDTIINAENNEKVPVMYTQMAVRTGKEVNYSYLIISSSCSLMNALLTISALIIFVMLILSINKSQIFEWKNVRRLRDALFILHRAEGKPFCLQCSLFFLKPRCSRAAFRPAPAS